MNQLSSDVQRGVRILHEWTHKRTRYRACTVEDPECRGAVYVDRHDRYLKKWLQTNVLVEEDAALVLELAREAGRMK